MTWSSEFQSGIGYAGVILGAMAVVALVETIIPLRARGRWSTAHLAPNLALTFITFATNIVFNVALVLGLVWLQSRDIGLLHLVPLSGLMSAAIVVLALDFTFYVLHRAMHGSSLFWGFHRIHHSDPAVDVTTTVRQHPGESVLRYVSMAVTAFTLGASPAAFAVYRVWSAVNGMLEHANIRVPRRLDTLLSAIIVTPNMHKVHHSRTASETDTNYSNIFSLFDRLFRTFTPSTRGLNVAYGLNGFDDPATQTTAGLLALPFRDVRAPVVPALAARGSSPA